LVTVIYGVFVFLGIAFGALASPVFQAVSTSAVLEAVNSNTLVWEGFWTVGALNDVLNLVVFVALYFAFRHARQGASALALITATVSSTVDLATNVPLNLGLVGLGQSFASPNSDVAKAADIAAAELTLNATRVGAEMAGMLFGVSIMFVSYALLKSYVFGKAAVYIGVFSGTLWLACAILVSAAGVSFSLPLLGFASLSFGIWALIIGCRLYVLCSTRNTAR
jgi:hypothetical protein